MAFQFFFVIGVDMKTTTRRQLVPVKQSAMTLGLRSSGSAPRVKRNFAKVDVANLSDEDEDENPDWLVGAN